MTAAITACFLYLPSANSSGAPPRVLVQGDRFGLHVNGMALVDLLTILGRETGIIFSVRGDPSAIKVSDSFPDQEILQGVRRVLSTHSHLLVDRGTVDSARHVEVILLGRATAQPARRIQTTAQRGEATMVFEEPVDVLLAKSLSTAPAAERAASVDAIAYRTAHNGGDVAGPLLVQMLSDPDAALRARAIETLKDTADQVPFAALAQIAREDASAALRIQALELLVERSENGESREALRIALNDPEPAVRARARELVLDWHVEGYDGATRDAFGELPGE